MRFPLRAAALAALVLFALGLVVVKCSKTRIIRAQQQQVAAAAAVAAEESSGSSSDSSESEDEKKTK